eukprot:CAMPEP_0198311526 /NCGR_PEP_ID=MMETSP1450-20131203/3219_1 /TAXON_ID=753684 ORGANISM="Madagascaria erythrocladiodes, Strain CCMP3234" /NCGR_SAMPLE_ID=MMETSP1450 /ASSEMBLY_ACC=CAM_ASM_001115 /LENGTH=290 /DNA_ID=CAMNT_0044014419 /DNA_START=107 /DNA_END=979 /DNA_ORIENTATION=+
MYRAQSYADEETRLAMALTAAEAAVAAAVAAPADRPSVDAAQNAVRALSRSVEALEAIADEQPTEAARKAALDGGRQARLRRNELAMICRRLARGVVLQQDRDQLLGAREAAAAAGAPPPPTTVEKAAAEVTSSLARTHKVVEEELARSTAAKTVLADSTRTLAKTRDRHQAEVKTDLDSGKATLADLRRQAFIDSVVVAASLILFVLVALYVLRRRLPEYTIVAGLGKVAHVVKRVAVDIAAKAQAQMQRQRPDMPEPMDPSQQQQQQEPAWAAEGEAVPEQLAVGNEL